MSDAKYNEVPCPVCNFMGREVFCADTLQGRLPNFDYNFSPDHYRTFRMVRCQRCTHVFSSPLPLNILENYVSVVDEVYLRHQASRLASSKKVCAVLRRHVPNGKLLDIGCATGDFLSVAKEFYEVQGLEFSTWSADLARAKGFEIHSRFLSEFKQPGEYDVITLWGVIEHFDSPHREVKEAFRLLKPGGIVALWTGDVDGLCSKVLKKKWWHIQGQHIQQFNRRSLMKLFEGIGFKKEWMGLYPYVMHRDAFMQSLRRYPTLCAVTFPLLKKIVSPQFSLTVTLPGEMFAIFRKPFVEGGDRKGQERTFPRGNNLSTAASQP